MGNLIGFAWKDGIEVPRFTRRRKSSAYHCVNGTRALRTDIGHADARMTDIEKEPFRGLLAHQTRSGTPRWPSPRSP